jgi:hypothetical protein
MRCFQCKKNLESWEAYEHRGVVACSEHFDAAVEAGDLRHAKATEREEAETERYRGLDFGDGPIGRANRQIFALRGKQ